MIVRESVQYKNWKMASWTEHFYTRVTHTSG